MVTKTMLGYLPGDAPIMTRSWGRRRDVSLDHVYVPAAEVKRAMDTNNQWAVRQVEQNTDASGLISVTTLCGERSRDGTIGKVVAIIHKLAAEQLAAGNPGELVAKRMKEHTGVLDALVADTKSSYGAFSTLDKWADVTAKVDSAASGLRQLLSEVRERELGSEIVAGVMVANDQVSTILPFLEGSAKAVLERNSGPAQTRAAEVAAAPEATRDEIARKLDKARVLGWHISSSADLKNPIAANKAIEHWARFGELYAGTSPRDPLYRQIKSFADIAEVAKLAVGE